MNETINEDLEILMIDRINKAFKKSEEYKEAVSAENDIYEELKTKISLLFTADFDNQTIFYIAHPVRCAINLHKNIGLIL